MSRGSECILHLTHLLLLASLFIFGTGQVEHFTLGTQEVLAKRPIMIGI